MIQIRNGETSSAPLISRFCGSAQPSPVISSGSSLWIKFQSVAAVQNYGFRARYSTSNSASGGGGGETGSGGGQATGQYQLTHISLFFFMF